MYDVQRDDLVLRELHRTAADSGRRGIAIPSVDLAALENIVPSRASALKALQWLVRSGRVVRVRKDLLVLPDAAGHLVVDMVDLVDAVAPRPYLITAGRALERLGLTDQHFFGLVVLTPGQTEPLTFRGQTAQFFRTNSERVWGAVSGPGPSHARAERAIVDALNHPHYGVSLTQTIDALLLAATRDARFLDRLHKTVVRYNSRGAARRVGLIIERFLGPEPAARYRDLIGENRSPVLMRPWGRPDGEFDPVWRVNVNALLEPERARP
jgi:predicted transcriptional regulator of viral defense system